MGTSLRRALIPALVVLALIAIVAVAATGSVPGGSTRTRRPPDVLLDTTFSLLALALIPAAILLVYGLMQRQEVASEYRKRKRRLSNGTLIVLLLLIPLIFYLRRPPTLHPVAPAQPSIVNGAPGMVTAPTSGRQTGDEYVPQFAWLPVLVILLLVAAAALAWHLSTRRRPAPERDATETIAEVLDDTLDDLRAEADPRRAVIAAYARLERALAAHGFPRRSSETQEELLRRVLDGLDVSASSIRRLTDLFERAKFSQHEVDVGMKEEAIGALEDVRDELRASEERRVQQAAEGAQLAEVHS